MIRQELKDFMEVMEFKLRKNDHKISHLKDNIYNLSDRVYDEYAEMVDAIYNKTLQEVMFECADVANFAMFIYDIARKLNEKYNVNRLPVNYGFKNYSLEEFIPEHRKQNVVSS